MRFSSPAPSDLVAASEPEDPAIERREWHEARVRRRLYALVERFRVGTLITHGAGGTLHARPMAVGLVDEASDEIGFVAPADSTLVAELGADPYAAVVFQDARHHVTWSGQGEIVREQYRVIRAWSREASRWCSDPESPDVVAVVVRPLWAEYWTTSLGASALRVIERATGTSSEPEETPMRHGVLRFELDADRATDW